MAEYKGSAIQIEIQKRMLARHDWIKDAPDIANGGRVLNFLDPQATGWDVVRTYLDQDGVVALTAQPRAPVLADVKRIFGADYDYPTWDVYCASAHVIAERSAAFLAANPLPQGWRVACFDDPDDAILEGIQSLNEETGVAPYPAFYTRSRIIPSLTACLWDDQGVLVATSSVNARYHPKSRFADYVFKGSTSVKPSHRGMGLGKVVNAHVLLTSRDRMGWGHAISQVQPSNLASVKTIAASGFTYQPDVVTIGIVAKGVVFTR